MFLCLGFLLVSVQASRIQKELNDPAWKKYEELAQNTHSSPDFSSTFSHKLPKLKVSGSLKSQAPKLCSADYHFLRDTCTWCVGGFVVALSLALVLQASRKRSTNNQISEQDEREVLRVGLPQALPVEPGLEEQEKREAEERRDCSLGVSIEEYSVDAVVRSVGDDAIVTDQNLQKALNSFSQMGDIEKGYLVHWKRTYLECNNIPEKQLKLISDLMEQYQKWEKHEMSKEAHTQKETLRIAELQLTNTKLQNDLDEKRRRYLSVVTSVLQLAYIGSYVASLYHHNSKLHLFSIFEPHFRWFLGYLMPHLPSFLAYIIPTEVWVVAFGITLLFSFCGISFLVRTLPFVPWVWPFVSLFVVPVMWASIPRLFVAFLLLYIMMNVSFSDEPHPLRKVTFLISFSLLAVAVGWHIGRTDPLATRQEIKDVNDFLLSFLPL